MADATRLLTPSELNRAMNQVDQCRARGDETISLSPREALRWLRTLRAAWEERDAALAALREVQQYQHACHGAWRGDCPHWLCVKIRTALGEPAGQDGG